MKNNQSGRRIRSASGAYLAAYSPIPRLNVAMAVARSPSEFISDAHRWGMANLVLALLAALIAAFVLERHVQRRSKGIARVTEDLSAIAKGELDRRIVLQSSDDARAIADNINVVTDRLRAQIAREEESRQFESFVRLSAMLTHDLKNAIEGLSLTVGNMDPRAVLSRGPARPTFSGHGLLGEGEQVTGGANRSWRASRTSCCAVSTGAGCRPRTSRTSATLLVDLCRFASLADRGAAGDAELPLPRPHAHPPRGVHRPIRLSPSTATAPSTQPPLLHGRQPGRDHGRLAHRHRAGLHARRARRAGDELLDPAERSIDSTPTRRS